MTSTQATRAARSTQAARAGLRSASSPSPTARHAVSSDAWAQSIERVAQGRRPAVVSGLDLKPVNASLWRATAPDGHVVGHIEQTFSAEGERFVAKRYAPHRSAFVALGEFWQLSDAAECLRNS
jgi:hypothetical protein